MCYDSFGCLEDARTGQEILAAVLLKESQNLQTCGLCFCCFLTLANDTGLVQLRSAQFIFSLEISTHHIQFDVWKMQEQKMHNARMENSTWVCFSVIFAEFPPLYGWENGCFSPI